MSLLSHRLFGPEAPDRQPYRPNSSFITWTISEDGTDFNIASMAHSHFYLGHYLGHSLQPARRFFKRDNGTGVQQSARGDDHSRRQAAENHADCRMDGQWEAIQNHDADLRVVGLPRLLRESQMDPGHFQLPREVSE